jgi:ferric-chelate reductase
MWPALVVWAFDRILRAGRLLWNNRFGVSKNKQYSTATVELISQDTVRLTLRRCFNWRAGQHAYVILPTVSDLPTEAHPFTIASIPDPLKPTEASQDRDIVFLIRAREGFTSRLRELATKGVCTVPALVDGPYGCPPDLTKYSTSILIAGACMSVITGSIRHSCLVGRWFWSIIRVTSPAQRRQVRRLIVQLRYAG